MFARVEKLKYRNYPKNSNSRKGSSKSWKLLISPQSSKPTLLEGEYPIQNLRGHHLFPLGQVSASEATGHPLATPLNRIESKTGAAGGERPRGGGRGGVIRGATVGNRGHEGAEREREGEGRTKKEVVLALRNRNLSNLFHSLLRIFLLFSLSLSRTTIPGTTDDAGTTRGRRDVTCPPSLPLSSTLRTTPFPPSCHSHL